LAESEARYRSLVEDANDIVAKLDLDLYFTTVNRLVVAPELKYDNEGLLQAFHSPKWSAKQRPDSREKAALSYFTMTVTERFGRGRLRWTVIATNATYSFTVRRISNRRSLSDSERRPLAMRTILRTIAYVPVAMPRLCTVVSSTPPLGVGREGTHPYSPTADC